jgi:integrase
MDLVPYNPCQGVSVGTKTPSRERVLSDEEIPLFWSACGNLGLAGAALQVLLLTGQRPGEVSRLRLEHLSADGWWMLPGLPTADWPGTKNKQTHRVFLPPAVQEMIAELSGGDREGFVFGEIATMQRAMKRICAKLKISRTTPRDLRRTCASIITRLGFDRNAMDRILNHRRQSISAVYDRYRYEVEDQKIMTTVADFLISIAHGTRGSNVISLRG